MQDVYVAFQNFCGVIGNISKKAYRNCAVLLTGAAVVALISFNSKEFGGGGKNKTAMLAISNSGMIVKEEEGTEDEQTLQIEETVNVFAGDTENSNYMRKTDEAGETGENSQKNEPDNMVVVLEETEGMVAAIQAEQRNFVSSENMLEMLEEENQGYVTENSKETVSLEVTPEPTAVPEPTVTPEPTAEPTPTVTPVPEGRVIMLDDRNYQVLLRIVEAEAGGESMEGKMLVANVILNRVAHDKFPNTVEEVVFERCNGKVQFSPTADGRFDSVVISQETIDAVEAVLCGADSSQGALFFSARSKADPDNMSWFDTHLKWLFACGGHEFYTLP